MFSGKLPDAGIKLKMRVKKNSDVSNGFGQKKNKTDKKVSSVRPFLTFLHKDREMLHAEKWPVRIEAHCLGTALGAYIYETTRSRFFSTTYVL